MTTDPGLEALAPLALPDSFRQAQSFVWACEARGELRRAFYRNAAGSRIFIEVECLSHCQGPPGYVHGGLIAALHDEAMALATRHEGRLAVTGWLKTEFVRPTPFPAAYRIEAWTEDSNPLSVLTRSRMTDAAGDVMNSSSARFVWVS